MVLFERSNSQAEREASVASKVWDRLLEAGAQRANAPM